MIRQVNKTIYKILELLVGIDTTCNFEPITDEG